MSKKVKGVFQTPEEKIIRRKEVEARSRLKRKEKIALYWKEYNDTRREQVRSRNNDYYINNKNKIKSKKTTYFAKYRVLKTPELKTKIVEIVDYQECDEYGN